MQRRLVLKKETLAELTTAELKDVAAGYQMTPGCPSNYCYSNNLRCYISQLIDPCLGATGTD